MRNKDKSPVCLKGIAPLPPTAEVHAILPYDGQTLSVDKYLFNSFQVGWITCKILIYNILIEALS